MPGAVTIDDFESQKRIYYMIFKFPPLQIAEEMLTLKRLIIFRDGITFDTVIYHPLRTQQVVWDKSSTVTSFVF